MKLGSIVIVTNNSHHINGASGVVIAKQFCTRQIGIGEFQISTLYDVIYGTEYQTSPWQECNHNEFIEPTIGRFEEDELIEVSYDPQWKSLLEFSKWLHDTKKMLRLRTYDIFGV